MKKIVSLLLIVLVVAGCNKEKTYKSELKGSWTVYKYLLYNVDQTLQFQNQNPNFYITFTDDGHFTKYYSTTFDTIIGGVLYSDTTSVGASGAYSFANNDEMLVLDYSKTGYTLVDTVYVPYTKSIEEKYTIFNLTDNHVQLRTDSSQLYMSKKP